MFSATQYLAFATLLCAISVHSQSSVVVTIGVQYGVSPSTVTARQQFAAAFRKAFSASVGLAGCLAFAPLVDQKIIQKPNFTNPTSATITFTYPLDEAAYPGITNAVALVVADPVGWFSRLPGNTVYIKRLVLYLGDTGGFTSSTSNPPLTPVGSEADCSSGTLPPTPAQPSEPTLPPPAQPSQQSQPTLPSPTQPSAVGNSPPFLPF